MFACVFVDSFSRFSLPQNLICDVHPSIRPSIHTSIQLQSALRSGEPPSTADKLWLELELSARPAVMAWGPPPPAAQLRTPEQIAAKVAAAGASGSDNIQNLQRGDFVGEVRALAIQTSDPFALSNLWLLVFRLPQQNAPGTTLRSSQTVLLSSHAVGDRIVPMGSGNAALVSESHWSWSWSMGLWVLVLVLVLVLV